MTNSNQIRITPAFFQAYDDAMTVLREASKHEGQRGGPATEALFGLLAYATAIEEASRYCEPARQIDQDEAV